MIGERLTCPRISQHPIYSCGEIRSGVKACQGCRCRVAYGESEGDDNGVTAAFQRVAAVNKMCAWVSFQKPSGLSSCWDHKYSRASPVPCTRHALRHMSQTAAIMIQLPSYIYAMVELTQLNS